MSKWIHINVAVRCKVNEMADLHTILTKTLNTHGYTLHNVTIPDYKLKLVEAQDELGSA